MMSRAKLRNPVAKHRFDVTAPAAITTAAWTVIITAMDAASDAFEVLNTTGSVLKIATGEPGSEVEIPCYILPSSEPHLVPWNIAKGSKISARAVDSDAADITQLVFNFYG
jgi:hypothetical protein